MVLGYMLYGIRKGFPNQGSFLKEDISGFGGVPSNLIYVEDIMNPSEIQSDMLQAAWNHICKCQLIWSKERASNHTQGGGSAGGAMYHVPTKRT